MIPRGRNAASMTALCAQRMLFTLWNTARFGLPTAPPSRKNRSRSCKTSHAVSAPSCCPPLRDSPPRSSRAHGGSSCSCRRQATRDSPSLRDNSSRVRTRRRRLSAASTEWAHRLDRASELSRNCFFSVDCRSDPGANSSFSVMLFSRIISQSAECHGLGNNRKLSRANGV